MVIASRFVRVEARSNALQCTARWPFLFGDAGRDLVHTHDKQAFMLLYFKQLSFTLAVAVLGATLLNACRNPTSSRPGTNSATTHPHPTSLSTRQRQDLFHPL